MTQYKLADIVVLPAIFSLFFIVGRLVLGYNFA